ncbi:hypothetical protein RD792_013679 [Penstemon davidsonii]|uniref:Glycosyltransferase n=1 Tax=Penstemon davidsonii TaxID=160366 RepID=A0ABR0CU61_9LAMI|nr:hypothetical protein RD792_013679 [Penstemon davidsonii]
MYISKPHGIIISAPYQGHINPFVSLALKLASNGFSITFAHFEHVHHMLSKSQNSNDTSEFDVFSKARESGLDIRYTTINDGFSIEYDRALHLKEYWESLFENFPARVDEFVSSIIESSPSMNHFLVADTIFHWHASIAKKHKLVNVSLWTPPALVFSLSYHAEILREHGHFPCKDNIEEEINYIPGVQTINTKDFMPYLKESGINTIGHKLIFMAFNDVEKVDFILYNTVQELESDTISALNKKGQKHYAIGPLDFSKNLPKNATVIKSFWSELDCAHWLDSKSPSSVLYVSFGSLVHTSKQVLQEIAFGLLLSEVNFILVVRSDIVSSIDTEVLPTGFIDEIKDRGLIIPWCNQIKVLSNPAVGGFLTHCGWNSIMESIWCITPMICYPITSDQPTNKKLVVDDWKIGIGLCDGTSKNSGIQRDEVAKKIKTFMSTLEGYKQEIKKVQAILQCAIEIDGSSERNFDQFVKDLKVKIKSNNEESMTN